jgi:hypothetical protein
VDKLLCSKRLAKIVDNQKNQIACLNEDNSTDDREKEEIISNPFWQNKKNKQILNKIFKDL